MANIESRKRAARKARAAAGGAPKPMTHGLAMEHLFGSAYGNGGEFDFTEADGGRRPRLRRGLAGPGVKMNERGWPEGLPPEGGD